MSDIKISVILPVYNVEKYLGDCLASILRQKVQDMEIIAVEDCSTDNSFQILEEFAHKYNIIRIIQNDTNGGLAYSRNRGLQAATGKYIYFVDSDDLLKDNALEYMYLCAEESDCDVIICNADRIDEDNKLLEREVVGKHIVIPHVVTGKELFCAFEKYNCRFFMSWLSFIKRDFLAEHDIRYIDHIIHEDMYFAFKVLMYAKKSMFVNHSFYLWRKREHSITFSKENVHNFKGYLKTYINVLNHFLANSEREHPDVNHAIEMYLKEIKRRLSHVYNSAIDIKQYQWNDSEKYMINLLFENKTAASKNIPFDNVDLPAEMYVYGAGMVAKEVLESLGTHNVAVKGCIVSEPEKNPCFLNGIKVYGLSEISDRNSNILVGVSKRFEAEIVNTLTAYGFPNIITL